MIAGIMAGGILRERLWTPADLSVAPKIWLDDESGYLSAVGVASEWRNRGSFGGAFTQPEASYRPVVHAAELSGKPVLRFDGVNDNMRMVSVDAADIFRKVAVGWSLVVGRKRGVDTNAIRGVFYAPNNTGLSRFNIQAGSSASPNTHIFATRRTDSQSTLSVAGVQGAVGVGWYIRCTHANWGADTLTDRVNGVEAVSALGLGSGLTSDTAGANQALGLGMASRLATPEGCGDIDLAAVVISSGATQLTASELKRLEGWAAHRYGLTANLPADHPYKHHPPTV